MSIRSNLCTEECVFILQQIHSFIIEQLLCAWRGAKAEATTRGRQFHGVVGVGGQLCKRMAIMCACMCSTHLADVGTKCLETRREGRLNSVQGRGVGFGKNFQEAFASASREDSPRQYGSCSGEVPEVAFIHMHLPCLCAQ